MQSAETAWEAGYMIRKALQKFIEELEGDASLYEPNKLRQRIEALDRLDAFNLEVSPLVGDSTGAAGYHCAKALQAKLEAANLEVYEAIRRDIQQGHGSTSLLQWMPTSAPGEDAPGITNGARYDYVDELIIGVLRFEETGAAIVQPTAEMVFYQPTPARHIFDLIDRTALNEHDVLVDLGSGLGHVPLLASICTRARSIGVELEPVYVHCARQSAETLNLKNVTFVQQDARAAKLTDGTVFYMYTPFTGKMLRVVLDSLQREGDRRDIRICTFGPCTATVADEDWLEAIGVPQADRVSIFRSCNRRHRNAS
ncbi:MAG TPA: class I SAM-dependent methyltransferase [Bryobacteraceae bacterium]|nr:class I SAM-dependent methyltransferase [Bryobacteraceae bacterium]